MIDSHCQLQFHQFDTERDEILVSCAEKSIGVINVGCEYESSVAAIKLAEQYPSQELWATVGQHPTDTGLPFVYKDFLELARSSRKVVAVGECGLDYFHLPKDPEQRPKLIDLQKDLFFQHLNLAHELHMPLVIHCRDAHDDMIAMLTDRYTLSGIHPAHHEERAHGVMHCFTGTWEHAQKYLELGFYISFAGIITFTDQYNESVCNTPFDKILIETDAPFLAPAPHRGKKNKPQYVRFVAEKIAALRKISEEEVVAATRSNTERLFRLR
jgi:TatD DNase family protein